jgi:predicted nucleotidyltransferase
MANVSLTSNQAFSIQTPTYEEVTRRILAVSDPIKVIVFGSHARGEGTEHSDLDILVVLDQVESTRTESIRLRRALRGLMYPIDILISTPQQLTRYQDVEGMIYKFALEEGTVIYERTSAS